MTIREKYIIINIDIGIKKLLQKFQNTFLKSNKNHVPKTVSENNKENCSIHNTYLKNVDLWNALKMNGLIIRANKGFQAPRNFTQKMIIAKQDFCVRSANGITRAPRKR